jgi:hypothetical protein
MKLTPGQLQEILQLSPATFRHWKSALAPLGGRRGYTPCFSPGDLLAMALVKTLTEDVGIRVGNLRWLAADLFAHCSQPWAGLERSTLIVEPLMQHVTLGSETQPHGLERLAIIIPLRPIIAALRERLLLERSDTQQAPLRFPPTAVAAQRHTGDAS